MVTCILGIPYVTAWRCRGLDSKHLICICLLCKDRTGVNYTEVLVSDNVVILGLLYAARGEKMYAWWNPLVGRSTKWREIPVTRY